MEVEMSKKTYRGYLIGAVIMLIAAALQLIGFLRYLDRLPDDLVGLGLYIVTIIALVISAFGFYIQWRGKSQEEG
jgi:NADH:ubiquinone oxidoreductase subunit K